MSKIDFIEGTRHREWGGQVVKRRARAPINEVRMEAMEEIDRVRGYPTDDHIAAAPIATLEQWAHRLNPDTLAEMRVYDRIAARLHELRRG